MDEQPEVFMDQMTAPTAATGRDAGGASTRAIIALDRGIYRFAGHWLAAANALFIAQIVSVLLAPVLVAWGLKGLARPIYAFNSLFCHQKDERSFTLFGEKVACCERCAAIYGALALFGIGYVMLRRRIERPRLIDVALLAAPVVLDGGAQLAGIWESSAATRAISGSMLGVAIGWFLLPYLDAGFARMRLQLETLFARLAAEGRAHPL